MPVSAKQRGHITQLLASSLLCAAAASGCSKPKQKAAESGAVSSAAVGSVSLASPAAASSAAPQPTGSNAPALGPLGHAPIPRESIKPPPLTPPKDALSGPGGVRYQVLKAGTGETPRPVDTIVVDYNMWNGKGELADSSYARNQSTPFSLTTLSPEFRSLLGLIHEGSTVRYWIPRAALAGWKPEEWPDSDLIIEFEMLTVGHTVLRDGAGNVIEPAPPVATPDASGPPASAFVTPSGLHYVYLSRGTTSEHPTSADHLSLHLSAYAIEGLQAKLLVAGYKTGTTLDRAPGGLSEVLSKLVKGDEVRVWLPPGKGGQVISDAGNRPVILDLAFTF